MAGAGEPAPDAPFPLVPPVDYARERRPGTAFRTIYNPDARRKAREAARRFRPDVAHLHNIHHQLTGSVYEAFRDEGVPVVQTLHDFQWVCPVYTFVSHGAVCERCAHGRYLPAVRHRCQDGSFSRSVVAALALAVGHWRRWERLVSRFIAPSAFLARKVVEHGLPAEKVATLGYCVDLAAYPRPGERGRHVLYAGRLSREKGVATLLAAAARVRGLELRVAGDGPQGPWLRETAAATAPGRVRFLGHLSREDLVRELGSAAFVVVPSEWYENQPYAVLEAFAMETPVLGARLGGIPELVLPGRTGDLFESGSAEALAGALAAMSARPDLRDLGRAGRAFVESRFAPAPHLEALLSLYERTAP
jgi:glycosyltransferase involved in cell wall biosynthesis